MVVPIRNLLEKRRGQSRILEAIIAALIIFIVFSVSIFLIRTSDAKIQERADLDRLGYNVMHKIVESGTIEETIDGQWSDLEYPKAYLKTIVQKSLPSATYFNLTIFNCTESSLSETPWIVLDPVASISNTSPDSFIKSMEVSSTSVTYTSKKGSIYYLVLILAKAGEA